MKIIIFPVREHFFLAIVIHLPIPNQVVVCSGDYLIHTNEGDWESLGNIVIVSSTSSDIDPNNRLDLPTITFPEVVVSII